MKVTMPECSRSQDDFSSIEEKRKCVKCKALDFRNEKIFTVVPLISLGAAINEFLLIFGFTGFQALDIVAVSSVTFLVFAAFSALLFIRFERLTILAFLMCSLSLLASSTFLVVSIENINASSLQRFNAVTKYGNETVANTNEANLDPEYMLQEEDFENSTINSTNSTSSYIYNIYRVGKILSLMKSGTRLRWIYEIQFHKECCGYRNYTDWIRNDSLQQLSWVPSCCEKNLTMGARYACSSDREYVEPFDVQNFLHPKGCGADLEREMENVETEMLKTSCWLVIWDFLIFADIIGYTICNKLKAPNTQPGQDEDEVFT